ncbi:MAG: Hsp20/alpha crystallin family protein [Dehalococcoidia bacterium]|nr:Hsp20/alpha crystallin family protein [Dehalococcoidia bacterium]
MPKKDQPKDEDISKTVGGTLNLFGLKLDLGKLLSSPEEVSGQLEGLRDRLKDLGGKETLSDEDWKGGAARVSGYVRVRSLSGEDEEYHIGTGGGRKRASAKPSKTAEPLEVVEPPLDIFDEPDGITIIADVPGVDLEDLAIAVEGRVLHISPRPTARRAYTKDVELAAEVDPESLQITCHNGVLEIRLSKGAAKG